MGVRAAARALVVASAAAIAACSNGAANVPPRVDVPNGRAVPEWNQVSIYAPGQTSLTKAITDGIDGPDAMAMDSSGNLYVANIDRGTVTVYARGARSPFRTIRAGVGQPVSLAVDPKGNLFVSNAFGLRGRVTEYAPVGNSVIRRIDATVDIIGWHDGQRGLAVDASGDLYAAVSKSDRVEIYRPHETTPSRIITEGVTAPQNLVFDRSGNLYVLSAFSSGSSSIYAPGAAAPLAQIDGGNDVAFDSRGNAYVSSWDSIEEYAPDHKTIIRTITAGIDSVNAIAVDRYDNLYVANSTGIFHGGSVTVYSHSDGALIRKIQEGISQPSELLFDKAGNLYVASYPHYE